MAEGLWEMVKTRYRDGHQKLLKMVEGLSDEDFSVRLSPTAHTIAFQVWHAARLTDAFQSGVAERTAVPGHTGSTAEIWHAERLSSRWGLDPTVLGANETGSGMDDSVAAALQLPSRDTLLNYARRAFQAADEIIGALDDVQLQDTLVEWGGRVPIGIALIDVLAHEQWNVGYIAALRRARGLPRILA